MRLTGTSAVGIRLPIINPGDNLVNIVADYVMQTVQQQGAPLKDSDIIGVTEGVVAKAEGNFATILDIAADVKAKFGHTDIGLVFPMLSRNRFLNILKGIAKGANNLYILLPYPHDEVGNPVMDVTQIDEVFDKIGGKMVTAKAFADACGGVFKHPFTGMDYVELYQQAGSNIHIYFSNDPRDILQLTGNIMVGAIHNRNSTKARLLKAGATKVYTLSDILSASVNDSGYNPAYGVLGSNLSTEDTLKLFPAQAGAFAHAVQALLKERTGAAPEVLVYGDGAFKDPVCGIWELADPVVSPGYTQGLGGQPTEIKFKFVADNAFGDLVGEAKQQAVVDAIKAKHHNPTAYREGTTPRQYADLVGSLCDLMGGSGDKGTPVILIRGYFDDFAAE
jgi:hypothetical protein